METVDKYTTFEIAVLNNIRTVFPRMDNHNIVVNKLDRGMIAHVTVHDRENRVVEGEIISVKITKNLIVECSARNQNLYYIFNAIDGKFHIQFTFQE